MEFEYEKLNVFREISNIGSGNASTSLAMMVGEIVDIGLPNSEMVKFSDITNSYTSPEELVVGAVLELSEDMEGFVMFIMKVDSALNLLSKITKQKITCDINDYEEVCKELNSIGEICNILCGAYLTSISKMTNLSITPSVPYFTADMVGAIMNLPAAIYGEVSDSILCIETDFFTLDRQVEGKYYFVPKVDSCEKLLLALGVSPEELN